MYKEFVNPHLLKHLPPEPMHDMAREAIHLAEFSYPTLKLLEKFNYGGERLFDDRLRTNIAGIKSDNPVWVGAGWDKFCRAPLGLLALGFGGVEVGGVTEYPQLGNKGTRLSIIDDALSVAINWFGFNSKGKDAMAEALKRYQIYDLPILVNIGINKDVQAVNAPGSYASVIKTLYPHAKGFVLCVSCPNVNGPEEVQKLQTFDSLTAIAQEANKVMDELGRRKPVFLKESADSDQRTTSNFIRAVSENYLAGIVAANTTAREDLKAVYGERWRKQPGGLSGNDPAYRNMTTAIVAQIYLESAGTVPVIGVGGVRSGPTALEKIKAGANAVELVTALRSEGPDVAGRINSYLLAYLEQEEYDSLKPLIGSDADKHLPLETHYLLMS